MKPVFKRFISILIATVLVCGLSGCSDSADDDFSSNSDNNRIMVTGTLKVGVTDYAPLDMKKDDGSWTGFDADLACGFAESLGVKASFVEIDWDDRINLLEAGKIDCIWNGMTKTEKLENSLSLSDPYLTCSLVVVMKEDQFKKYDSIEKCGQLLFSVERGSLGQAEADERGVRTLICASQSNALQDVWNGKCDAAIVDTIIASELVGEGKEFDGLRYDFNLNPGEIVVGFRKNSPLKNDLNAFLESVFSSGKAKELAEKYGLSASLVQR